MWKYDFEYSDFAIEWKKMAKKAQEWIHTCEKKIENSERYIAQQREELFAYKNKINDMEQKILMKDKQIRSIHKSISWKITKPLRVFSKHGKGMEYDEGCQENSCRSNKMSYMQSVLKIMLFHSNGRIRTWAKIMSHAIMHNMILQKIARKSIFTTSKGVRKLFIPLYELWMSTDNMKNYSSNSKIDRKPENLNEHIHHPVCSVIRHHKQRLTVVSMARNEIFRVHDAMRHFCALFDRIVLIDHLSDDDTGRIAMEYNGVSGTEVIVIRGEDSGYYQSEYMSACANALIRESESEWIFFLDFDELLPFRDAGELRQALAVFADIPVIHMNWLNVALVEFDPDSLQGVEGIIGTDSEYVKIAINVPALGGREVVIAQGNHSVSFLGENIPLSGVPAFGMFHVPILGREAMKAKVKQGTDALKKTIGKGEEQGFHWREMSAELERLMESDELVCAVALHYSRPLKDIVKLLSEGKAMEGTRRIRLHFAQSERAKSREGDVPSVRTFTLNTINTVLEDCFPPLLHGREESVPPALASPLYQPLSARSVRSISDSMFIDALLAATEASPRTAEIPFLFALLEVFRPRRYVEFGAEGSMSFFPVCQHIRINGNYGEAVAIFDNNDEFDTFSDVANYYKDICRTIQGKDDAHYVFENNSVDILYIKNVYEYKEINKIYSIWKNKISDNGAVIIQNTNKYMHKTGVWQFFEEVRYEADISFRFFSGSGTGILAFGSSETNPIIDFIKRIKCEPQKAELYFSNLGRVSW